MVHTRPSEQANKMKIPGSVCATRFRRCWMKLNEREWYKSTMEAKYKKKCEAESLIYARSRGHRVDVYEKILWRLARHFVERGQSNSWVVRHDRNDGWLGRAVSVVGMHSPTGKVPSAAAVPLDPLCPLLQHPLHRPRHLRAQLDSQKRYGVQVRDAEPSAMS